MKRMKQQQGTENNGFQAITHKKHAVKMEWKIGKEEKKWMKKLWHICSYALQDKRIEYNIHAHTESREECECKVKEILLNALHLRVLWSQSCDFSSHLMLPYSRYDSSPFFFSSSLQGALNMRFISTVRWSCAITSAHLSNRTVFVFLCCWCVIELNSMHLNGVFGVLPNSRIVFQFNAKADTHTARLPSQIDLEDFSVFIRRTLINDRPIKIQNHWHIITCTRGRFDEHCSTFQSKNHRFFSM